MNKSLMVVLVSIALSSSPVTAMADQQGWGNDQGSDPYSQQRSSAAQWNNHHERNNRNAYQWNNHSSSGLRSAAQNNFGHGDDQRRYFYGHYNYYQPNMNNGNRYHHRAIYRVGGRLPEHYRSQYYYVNNWRSYHLQPPPYDYGWVNVDGDFILVALATGLIAEVILNNGY